MLFLFNIMVQLYIGC